MDFTTQFIISEIFNDEQLEAIGFNEASDIFTKDENGKKVIDIDKVKVEFDRIKNMTDEEAQANKTKSLIQLIVGYIGTLTGIGIMAAGGPTLFLIGIVISSVGIVTMNKIKPLNRTGYYNVLSGELKKLEDNLIKSSGKLKKKDPDKAKELDDKIKELRAVRTKLIAERDEQAKLDNAY